ncbi:sigma-70 family RNA polymerase sigma factor [Sutcliffiella sp. NC1]|uniref:sigma-70 family RNA polymerase sigma factor n=1 Tax=Sutcliffiella sp. NC1 TaxID=3004096 RepID=UPI0022DD1887|nr:sigma-70 family RNA polymerase sigma factor [Sutcliffiella sp. NC1]WBL14598.1 sigma-70 family RNA polymerase sigma factor [Sutcliffiella sp. NC1]
MDIRHASFTDVLEQYRPMIYKIINTLHIYRDHSYYFHEGVVALWTAYKQFNEEKGSFPAYAYTTIRGSLLNVLKAERHFDDHHAPWDKEFEEFIPDNSVSLDEQINHLEPYVVCLTNNQKIWVVEHIFYGKGIKEIAREHRTTEAAVKSWRRGAIKKIREEILKYKKMNE